MAENGTPSSALPPPPSTGAAPGQLEYNATMGAPGAAPSHMPPPPLPPLGIPQNMNPIPTAVSAGGDMMGPDMMGGDLTPGSVVGPGGQIRRAAPEPNKRALYVGGLDPRVTEEVLRQIFETAGNVVSVKIIPDKNSKGLNYGFIEYDDPQHAERAMQTLNGRRVHQSEIRVNWAYQSNQGNKEDTSNHYHIFVGDLSNEVNDEVLLQAFSAFGSVSEARVMWDMKTGRSRGYGFVAFRERQDAEKALASMDGEWLGSRAIRCNWANQKGQPSISQQQAMAAMGMTPTTPMGHHHFPTHGVQSYDMVVNQTPSWQTTCYVGNLTPYTTQNDLVPLFQNFGYVIETRFQADRGFAFVKMDTHENAAMAICQLNGYNVNGRPLKCSWGKDRPPTGQFDHQFSPTSAGTPGGFQQQPFFPQYGGPSPMTPQAGPSPGGHQGFGGQQAFGGQGMPSQGMPTQGMPTQGMPAQGYAGMPGNASGYGRGQPQSAGGWAGAPQQQGYNGYQGGYQG